MDKVIETLLKSELLNEETKSNLKTEWQQSVAEYKKQLTESVRSEVMLELSNKFAKDTEALVANMESLVSSTLEEELNSIKDELASYRDLEAEYEEKKSLLEAEYAKKLVDEKYRLAEEVASELDVLVDGIDSFINVKLDEEITILKEDIEIAKKDKFGKMITEAFAQTFEQMFVDESSLQGKLKQALSKLNETESKLEEAVQQKNTMLREAKMEQVLSNLSGKKREQMAMILKNIETERLQESYNYFIAKILKEDINTNNKESLLESLNKTTKVVTGNNSQHVQVNEASHDAEFDRTLRIAGLK